MSSKNRKHCPTRTALGPLMALALAGALPVIAMAQTTAAIERHQFNIKAQALASALLQFSKQADRQIIGASAVVNDARTDGVSGNLSVGAALTQLLKGTGLGFELVGEKSIRIVSAARTTSLGTGEQAGERSLGSPLHLAQSEPASPSQREGQVEIRIDEEASTPDSARGTPEVLVQGARVLNVDIPRHRDDAQPYVIFDREIIANSGAISIEDFLKSRLPQNSANFSFDQGAQSTQGAISQINLRGLGTNQTLILIDGHRAAPIYFLGNSGTPLQSDLNGIPLSAVERIEVLPTTASGIYGGSATGGVVNVILRREYAGLDVRVTYRNTFDTDAAARTLDLSGGFALEGGRTSILLAGSHTDRNSLLVQDRDFRQRGLAHILSRNNNNPQSLNAGGGVIPPLGATSNIRSTTGVNLTLRDGTPLNSPITHVPVGYAGPATDGGLALVGNAGSYNLDLADSAQLSGGAWQSLLSHPEVSSLSATARRQFSPGIQAFLEAGASDSTGHAFSGVNVTAVLPATAPNNPFNQAIRVSVPTGGGDAETLTRTKSRRLVGGIIVKLPADWMGGLDYTWHRTSNSFASPSGLATAASSAINSGAIDVLRDIRTFPLSLSLAPASLTLTPFEATLRDLAVRFSGPVRWFREEPATVSALLEHRRETFHPATLFQLNISTFFPERSQQISSLYLETRLPVITDKDRISLVRTLELQAAGRWDQYVIHGSGTLRDPTSPIVQTRSETTSTNPTLGLRYEPFDQLLLRASFGRGFLPPAVSQLTPTAPLLVDGALVASVLDPLRGNTSLGTHVLNAGGSPDLQPERSESWSAGIVFTPRFLEGLRLSVDYTNIEKTSNITSFGGTQLLLNNESLFPGRITRGPNLPGDAPGWAGPVSQVNLALINIARGEVGAYDAQLDYRKTTARGAAFDLFAVGTWQTHFKTQLVPAVPVVENVGLSSNFPVKFKANAGINWIYGPWTAGWSSNYYHSYLVADPSVPTNAAVIANQGNGGRVPSQIYHDAYVGYRFGDHHGWLLKDTELQAGVKNIFNKEPPVDLGIAGGSILFYSPFGDPRLANYHISIRHSF